MAIFCFNKLFYMDLMKKVLLPFISIKTLPVTNGKNPWMTANLLEGM